MKQRNVLPVTVFFLLLASLLWVKGSADAEIVEKIDHRDHGANGIEGAEAPDPPKTKLGDVFPPFKDIDAGSIITGIEYRFNSTQDLVNAVTGGAQNFTKPSLEIILGDNNLQPGTSTSVMAMPMEYDSIFTDQYFAWCLGTRESRITQNGLVAGGTRIPQDGNKSDCYNDVRRLPDKSDDVDANNDGMGDKWESRYFGTTRVDVNGDADHDGFTLDSTNGISGPNGVIRLVPNSIVVAKGKEISFGTCDGNFTNGEEWVWGTNPIDPDTDDDGYGDEQDVCGKGQVSFQYTPPDGSKQGDSEFVEAIAVGYATYREGNGSQKLAKIANSAKTLNIGNGEELTGALEYRLTNSTQQESQQDATTKENLESPQQDIYVGDEIELHAAIDNSQDDEANLHYQWTFQLLDGGVDTPNTPNRVIDTTGPIPQQYALTDSRIGSAGFGLNPYRLEIGQAQTTRDGTGFNIMPKTGNKILVTVSVIEPETGKKVEISQEFPIAISVLLDFSPTLPIQPLYPQADVSSAPEYTVTAVAPGLSANDFLYEWYIDEEKQPNAKIGGSTMKFKAVKQGGDYNISVVLTRVADETVFAEADIVAPVSPLSVSIDNCTKYTEGGVKNSVGQKISLQATIVAQGSYPGELTYQWFVNGQPFTDASKTPINQISFVPSDAGSYNAEYKIESVVPSEATSAPYVPLSISDTCRISVEKGGGTPLAERASLLFASAISSLPTIARGLLTFFGIIFVIFVIMLLVRNQYKNKS